MLPRDGERVSGIDVSAVVIARNEQAHIGAVLESVLGNLRDAQASGDCGEGEVLLVDSASTDRTVEIARRHPVKIVQLRPHWPLSAPAARFIGHRVSRGRFLLFVDGDFVLDAGFLRGALPHVRAGAGAVCGVDREHRSDASPLMSLLVSAVGRLAEREPEGVPIGLYSREALERAGGFHPFLRGGEDRETARRMRSLGFRVFRIPVPMGEHHWSDGGPMPLVTYLRSVLTWSYGDGQVARVVLRGKDRNAVLWRYVDLRHIQAYGWAAGLLAGTAALFAFLASPPYWPMSVIAAAALPGAFVAAKARTRLPWRNLLFELHAIPYSLIRHGGFLLGMIRGARPPSAYPTDYLVLQDPGGAR